MVQYGTGFINKEERMKEVYIKGSVFLSDVFEDLPDNVYLDKTNCGCGATTLALKNKVKYVVLVPSVYLVKNKTQQNNGVFGFYGDIKSSELVAFLECGGEKVIATYDSFNRLFDLLNAINDITKWKLLIDEAHNLINLAELKANVLNYIMDNYSKFGSYVFVTATPTQKDFLPEQLKDIEMVKYVWEDSDVIDLCVQQTSDIVKDLTVVCKQHLDGRLVGNAHIFINSVTSICSIVNKLRRSGISTTDNTKIVCADTITNKALLKKYLGSEWRQPSQPNCGGSVIFYTSVAFEGSDVYDEDGVTYIGVDCSKNNTKLDMSLSVAQIVGRVRDSKHKGKLKMLVAGMPLAATATKEEYCEFHNSKLQEAIDTVSLFNQTSNNFVKESLLASASNDSGYINIDDGCLTVNYLMFKLQMQRYAAMHSTYTVHNLSTDGDKCFVLSDKIINANGTFIVPTFEDTLVTNEKMIWEDMCKAYIAARESGDNERIKLIELYEPVLQSIYDTLGIQRIKALRYGKKALSLELESVCPDATVFLEWRVGDFIPLSKAKERIQEYYNLRGDRTKAKAVDAFQWYSLHETKKRVGGKWVYGFIVNGILR